MSQANQAPQPSNAAPAPARANGPETLEQKVARLERENAAYAAKEAAKHVLTLKISVAGKGTDGKERKGGTVCLYGINSRFPVSLYANQWKRLLAHGPEILAFIEKNKAILPVKE